MKQGEESRTSGNLVLSFSASPTKFYVNKKAR